jgi:hypothetical protein
VLLLDRFGGLHHEHAPKAMTPEETFNNRVHAIAAAEKWTLEQGYNGLIIK